MSQQIQELIDKIKSEGIQTAEQKASEIERNAQQKAQSVIEDAKKEAAKIVNSAQNEAKKTEEKTHVALQQAARDMILALRKEIEQTLSKIINTEVSHSLNAEQLADILSAIIEDYLKKDAKGDISVFLSQSDLKKLKENFVAKVQNKFKSAAIEFHAGRDIHKGFAISFDQGKSSFDFTDHSLAEYLSTYLNPEIASLLKEATASSN